MIEVHRVREYAFTLPDRPGALAGLLTHIANAGVDIDAMTLVDSPEYGVVHLIGSPAGTLDRVATSGEVALQAKTSDVLVVHLPHQPGVLAQASERLRDARVNVRHAYVSTPKEGESTRWVLRVSDLDQAVEALAGLTVG